MLRAKTKSPRNQIFWHVGFGISLFTAVLGPQQPQARNVVFATATAVAATTHSLATHLHQNISVRGITRSVNIISFRNIDTSMHSISLLDACRKDPGTALLNTQPRHNVQSRYVHSVHESARFLRGCLQI